MTLPLEIRPVSPDDYLAVDALHARVSGPGRYAKASYRVREGLHGHSRWCRAVWTGQRLIAAVRFTPIAIGGDRGPLLLGPLAVEPELKGQGLGKGLVAHGLQEAAADGVPLVLLVGDRAYYERFGFVTVPAGRIAMPGPVDPARLLARELQFGAIGRYAGMVIGLASAA